MIGIRYVPFNHFVGPEVVSSEGVKCRPMVVRLDEFLDSEGCLDCPLFNECEYSDEIASSAFEYCHSLQLKCQVRNQRSAIIFKRV